MNRLLRYGKGGSLVAALVCALVFVGTANADNRPSTSKKGSLLVLPSVELKWDANNALVQDTIISITNDYNEDVFVHFLFVNGDDYRAAEFCCDPPLLVEREHQGWNKQNWTAEWTGNESNYFSLNSGLPKGAPPFAGLDNGVEGPGRPDDEAGTGRVLRGFVLAWAVDSSGYQVSWNHLGGTVTTVHYGHLTASEYNAYAFQTVSVTTPGERVGSYAGSLKMDGVDYDYNFNRLLLDFFGSGSTPFGSNGITAMLETDVTLLPMVQDLRQNNDGPVHTKAKFDVWNQNEDFLSHSDHCLQCWDQILLSNVALPNNFLVGQLQTDKGKARIDGEASPTVCDAPACCDRGDDACIEDFEFENPGLTPAICSEDAPLLGVANKIIAFSGAAMGHAYTAVTLTGQGTEEGKIKSDLPSSPEPAQVGDETNARDGGSISSVKRSSSTR